MSAGCGPNCGQPYAYYDHGSSSWRTPQESLGFGTEPSPVWRTSGRMTRDGLCYELPTSGPATSGRGSSYLLPTPAAQEPGGTVEAHLWRKNRIDGANRTKPTHLSLALKTLPTLSATSYGTNQGGSDGQDPQGWSRKGPPRPSLETMARTGLLPTPTANDPKNAGYRKGPNGRTFLTLPGAVGSAPGHPFLPTPTSRDWKDGSPCGNVETNALLGRSVWSIGEPTSPPSADMNKLSDDRLPLLWTDGDD